MSKPLPAFSLKGVSFGYHPSKTVLEGIGVIFKAGEFYAVIGPNGAGKSTLLGLLSGRLHPNRGEVLFQEKPVSAWPRKEFARQVAVVPQREESVFDFTVRELVLMGRFPFQRGPFGLESAQDHEIVERTLGETDLEYLADRPIGALSGGERQRTLVARALAQEPSVLLLDEPNSALDPLHQKMLMELVLRLNREQGRTIILVTHDLALVGSYSNRALVIDRGQIRREGPTREIVDTDYLSEVYQTRIGVERREDGSVLVGLLR
jgi:iron complex transport system ATP-binding protein